MQRGYAHRKEEIAADEGMVEGGVEPGIKRTREVTFARED